MTRDGTGDPVARDTFNGGERRQGNVIIPVQHEYSIVGFIGNLARLIHNLAVLCAMIRDNVAQKLTCNVEGSFSQKTTKYLEDYWPCSDVFLAVNAISTQLRDPINSGLTRWNK